MLRWLYDWLLSMFVTETLKTTQQESVNEHTKPPTKPTCDRREKRKRCDSSGTCIHGKHNPYCVPTLPSQHLYYTP